MAKAFAIRKTVVQIIKRNEEVPFDVATQRTIYYDIDLESAAKCREKLINQIRAAERDPEAAKMRLPKILKGIPHKIN